jgi:hypothetical protein
MLDTLRNRIGILVKALQATKAPLPEATRPRWKLSMSDLVLSEYLARTLLVILCLIVGVAVDSNWLDQVRLIDEAY